jgi:hypothetical protein
MVTVFSLRLNSQNNAGCNSEALNLVSEHLAEAIWKSKMVDIAS